MELCDLILWLHVFCVVQAAHSNQTCKTCREGEGMVAPCSNTSDTVCKACIEGLQYSTFDPTINNTLCINCTNCTAQHRLKEGACSVTGDAVCGECLEKYFLYVDSEGNADCRRCSRCPGDGGAVHWYECEQAGLPLEQQCAPGFELPSSPDPMSTTATPDVKVKGGFVSVNGFGVVTSERPNTVVGISVSTLSLVFTVATLVAVSVGLVCVVVRRDSLLRRRMVRMRCCGRDRVHDVMDNSKAPQDSKSLLGEGEKRMV